jgi:hypothetical protein
MADHDQEAPLGLPDQWAPMGETPVRAQEALSLSVERLTGLFVFNNWPAGCFIDWKYFHTKF